MFAIAICSNALVGYHAGNDKGEYFILILPLVVSIAFLLVADIDSPRAGLIKQLPKNLISLSQSLRAQ
jgi:hypothetical protein